MSDAVLKEIPDGFESGSGDVPEPVVEHEQDEFLDDGFFEETFGNEPVEDIPTGLEEDAELIESLAAEEEAGEEEIIEEEEVIEDDDIVDEDLEEEEVIDEELEEGEALEEGEELEEEGHYYDPERDYPDEKNLSPNIFKTEQDANIGLVSKASYIEKLTGKLEELGSGVGAIELPSILNGDLANLDEQINLEAISQMDGDSKKTAIKELDQFINNVKGKVERVETTVQQQEMTQEAQETLDNAYRTIDTSLKVFGLNFDKIASMNDTQVFEHIDNKIQKLEADADTQIVDRGYSAFKEDLTALQSAKADLKSAQQDIITANETRQKAADTSNEVTPEQIQSAYDEFRADRPDLWIFTADTDGPETSFVKTVKQKGWDVATPRDWVNAYKKFDALVNTKKTKQAVSDLRKEADKTKKKTSKKKKPNIVQPNNPNRPTDRQWDNELDNFTEQIFG